MLGRRTTRDMARGRTSRDSRDMRYDYGNYDSRYDYNDYNDYGDYRDYEAGTKISGYYGKTPFEMRRDYTRDMRDYARNYARDIRDYGEDMRDMRDYARRGGRRDYGYDYAMGSMSPQEIKEWTEDLMSQMEDREKEFFKKDRVIKRAEELGISFDDTTPEEFYVTVLMLYTDYKKDIGTASIDPYINMAKDWLKDPDSALKHGEKLTAYHDYIIMGYK